MRNFTTVQLNFLKNRIRAFEDEKLESYLDSKNIWTIGVGHNLTRDNLFKKFGWDGGASTLTITKKQSDDLLSEDLGNCIKELKNNIKFFDDLAFAKQVVLIDMCFHMGLPKLLEFKKMLRAMEEKDFEKAAKELLDSDYARGFKNRSRANKELMLR